MILIEVTNVDQLVKKEKGYWTAKFAPYLTNLTVEVEKIIVEEIKAAFEARGIEANIVSVNGVRLHYSNGQARADANANVSEAAAPQINPE